jgi:UDP-N-acetylmuramoyl-L-alanyl-D-glutamate--2,6-diaminopimelate ligase
VARAGDLVLIAGKGHETYQTIAGVNHPFDDRQVARGVLRAGTADLPDASTRQRAGVRDPST